MLTQSSHLSRKLLTAVGGSLVLLVAVAVLGAYRYHDFIQHTNRINTDAIEAVTLALQAQVHFKDQVKEWQQVLLTGAETNFYDLHMDGIKKQYNNTRATIDKLLPLILYSPDANRLAEKFLAAHYMLYVDYLEAIAVFNYYFDRDDRSISSYNYAAGIDEEPSKLLDQLLKSVIAYRDVVLTEHNRQLQLLEYQLLALSGLMIVATSITVLLLLRRTVLRPLALATQVARRISDGHFDTAIPPATPDESGQLLGALAIMQQSIRRSTKDLRELQAAIDAHAIVSISDPAGRITYVNERFTAKTGYSAAELIGQNHRILRSDHHDADFFREMWDTISSGRIWHGEVLNRSSSGKLYWIETTIYPVLGTDGKPEKYIAIRTDITSLKTVQRQLTKARDAALQATLAKSAFLANMSHEIRTPMSGVLGMLDLLTDSQLTPEQRNFVTTARDSGQALLTLINGILDLSKIEADSLDLEHIEFDLCKVAESVCTLFSAKAFEKALELICYIDPQVPQHIVSDPTRLKQILGNLIGNAIKFTDHGSVSLAVTARDAGENTVNLLITVADTGIGIPPQAQADIFAPFNQADTSTTRRYGGTGLGLSISKKLVELFGGTLDLDSQPGTGSVFSLQIPVKLPDGSGAAPPALDEPLSARTIILVSDNARLIEPLTRYLHHWGARVELAPTIAQLHSHPDVQQADAILIDAGPQRREPEAAMAMLGELEPVAARTVILAPAACPAARLAAARIADCISKPVRRAELLERLQNLFAGVPRTMEETAEALTDDPATPLPHARILVAEDNAVNQQVITGLLQALGLSVEVVATGRAAVTRAFEERWDLILMDCHMPEQDGFEATREIRERESAGGLPRTPIVALTANAFASDRDKCLLAGMDDYLAKPVQRDRLRQTLLRWLSTLIAEARPAESPQPPQQPEGDIDWKILAELRGAVGAAVLPEIVRTFFASAEQNLAEIHDAAVGIDTKRLYPPAHNLKATSGTLGAVRLQHIALQLESCARAGDCGSILPLVEELEAAYQRVHTALTEHPEKLSGTAAAGLSV